MTHHMPIAGRPATFKFDLQLLAEDDDLGEAPSIDISSLSDDAAQLKSYIKTLVADGKNARKEAIRRRTERDALRNELKAEKDAHVATKTALETDLGKVKGELETANRSNGQLRGKFREQFVDSRVRTELEKRGANEKQVEDAMKLIDLSKIEFDEEKLEVKNADALSSTLDEFAKERSYLFGEPQQQQQRQINGTSFGRGASDAGARGGNLDKFTFDDPNKSIDQLTAEFAQQFS